MTNERSSQSIDSLTIDTSLTDAGGIPHTGQLLDLQNFLGISLAGNLQKTEGTSATAALKALGPFELRSPGEAAATDEARIFDNRVEFDPADTVTIRFNLSNITIDNDSGAQMYWGITDAPDTATGTAGNDNMWASVFGDGRVRARLTNDGASNPANDTTEDNAFAAGLNYVQFGWDGTTLTVEASDGTDTVTVTNSTNYPAGENLFLSFKAVDADGSNARNADFDVDSIKVS